MLQMLLVFAYLYSHKRSVLLVDEPDAHLEILRQKQVFVMRYYDEMKYEEMEAILGTSTGSLKASFHHAVKKIEEFLKSGLNR